MKDPDSEYRREFHGIEYLPGEGRVPGDAPNGSSPREDSRSSTSSGQTETDGEPGVRGVPTARQGVPASAGIWKRRTPRNCSTSSAIRPAPRKPTARAAFSTRACPRTARSMLDFNKAYNPPCAFTPYATCPLPPAGEQTAGAHRGGRKEVRPLANGARDGTCMSRFLGVVCWNQAVYASGAGHICPVLAGSGEKPIPCYRVAHDWGAGRCGEG